MKNLYESIIGSNRVGIMSEEVFNKRIKEEFEKAFKNLVNFKYIYKDPLDWTDMASGNFVYGWAITLNGSVVREFKKNIEKFIQSIKQYKPRAVEDNDIFNEVIENYEIRIQKCPDDWYDEPNFYISLAEDVDGKTHSKYWLLLGYDDVGIHAIFLP